MMEKELGADVIKATQTSLGKYVKRPPLSEKLLRKPPFRFLHDIVSAVNKSTGFFEGLFEEDELISDNVKDRDSKILFLNKVISVIGTTTGKSLPVKSSKIVSGQEPEKTNELLQCLALALDKKLSSAEAVKKYKDSVKAPVSTEIKQKETDASKAAKKSNETKNLKSKSNEKLTTNKKELRTVNKSDNKTSGESKTKKTDNNVAKNEVLKKSTQQKSKNAVVPVTSKTESLGDLKGNKSVDEEDGMVKDDINKIEERDQLNVYSKIEDTKEKDDLNSDPNSTDKTPSDQEFHSKLNSSFTIAENELNSSLSSQDLMEVEHIGKLTEKVLENIVDDISCQEKRLKKNTVSDNENKILPIKSAETALARADSAETNIINQQDKRKTIEREFSISTSIKGSDVVRPPSVRPSSSRPGAPRLREKIDSVLPENDNILLAKVNIITENTNNEDEEETSVIVLEQHAINDDEATSENQLSSIEHGHLVQQILDSQKEFSQVGKTEIEWQFGAQKVKEAVHQEIEQLRFNIQALSRVANPLGKLLDHIQEDAEVMRQELQQWIKVYDEVSKEMQKQKTANDETLVPLQTRMKQLDVDIQEKHDKIDDLKILIHKNASRVEKLLINGNVQ